MSIRYIKAIIPNNQNPIEVEYDTEVTEIAYRCHNDKFWKQCINHEYREESEQNLIKHEDLDAKIQQAYVDGYTDARNNKNCETCEAGINNIEICGSCGIKNRYKHWFRLF
jgi:hypothetical protein